MKILSLDLGDSQTGVAISDALQMLARPYTTVKTNILEQFLMSLLENEEIEEIVVGLPKTMKGRDSEQTISTIEKKDKLEQLFGKTKWTLWDERLSSKRAAYIQQSGSSKKIKNKEKSHAIAAALILESYLNYLAKKRMS